MIRSCGVKGSRVKRESESWTDAAEFVLEVELTETSSLQQTSIVDSVTVVS